jgi:hypothetical protein
MFGAALASLLAVATLCGFGCWGVYETVQLEKGLRSDVGEQLAAITTHAITLEDQGTYSIDQAAGSVQQFVDQARPVLASAKSAVDGLQRTETLLNQPCGKGHACGTVAELNEAIRAGHHAIGQVEIAANHENKRLDVLDKQEVAIADATQADLVKLGGTLDNLNLAALDLRALTPNLQRTAAGAAVVSEQVAGIATDGRKVADHYEHVIDDPKKVPLYVRILPPTIRMIVQAALERWAMSK